MTRAWLIALVLASAAPPVVAQPAAPETTAERLRSANAAALAGDWARVHDLVAPLFAAEALAPAELGEAHRLTGIAAFFAQRRADAETHFVLYLQIDPDARLDPALYPPEVVAFFNDVASRHTDELRARRARPRRYLSLNFLPPAGQFQNGESTKSWVIGGVLAGLLATNLTTYGMIHDWCDQTSGPAGGGLDCGTHHRAASIARPINLASGIAFAIAYVYGVYDGVRGYRRWQRTLDAEPYVATSPDRKVFGIQARF